jgi:hypothetical protein
MTAQSISHGRPEPLPVVGRRHVTSRTLGFSLALVVAVVLIVIAYDEARTSAGGGHFVLFWAGYLLGFGAILVAGLRSRTKARDLKLLVGLGTFLFLPKFLMSVNRPSFFDEWGHWRHVNDILATGSLTPPDPFQVYIKYFPGLGATTAAVHEVTRLPTWHAGQLVILVAHVGALLAVYGIARMCRLSNRAAFVSAAIYAANPNFLYFDSQYGYESLGLPLALCTIYIAMRTLRAQTRQWVWLGATFLAATATAVTHHVSSIFMGVMVVLIAIAYLPFAETGRQRLKSLYTGLVGAAVPIIWLVGPAHPTLKYLSPRLTTVWRQVLQSLGLRHGSSATSGSGSTGGAVTGHSLFEGGTTPIYEKVVAVGAPIVITVLIALGLVTLVMKRRVRTFLGTWPFALLGLGYFVSLPTNFLASASEVVHRSWAYSYLGIAVIGGIAWQVMQDSRGESGDQPVGRWLRGVHTLTQPSVLIAVVLVAGMGNIPAGTNVLYRFPGPYQFSSDSWGVTSETVKFAKSLRTVLPSGAGVVTDRVTGEVITGYTKVRVPDLHQGAVFGLYIHPDDPNPALRSALAAGDFRYFILDTTIFKQYPEHSWFAGYSSNAVNPVRLSQITENSFIHEVYRYKQFVVYAVNP